MTESRKPRQFMSRSLPCPRWKNSFLNLEQIWESRQLTNSGPFHQQFEQALCDYLGVKHAVGGACEFAGGEKSGGAGDLFAYLPRSLR